MTKYLKIRIRKRRAPEATSFSYPPSWNASRINVLAYEDHPDRMGDVDEFCIVSTDDEHARELLANHPMEVMELSETDARALSRQFRDEALERAGAEEVSVRLSGRARALKAEIEELLKAKGFRYRIDETPGPV